MAFAILKKLLGMVSTSGYFLFNEVMWRCDVFDTLSVRLLGAKDRRRGQICAIHVKAP